MLADKLGDNAQVELVGAALGWPCETRRLAFLEPYRLGKPRFRPSIKHVDTARSDRLEPPWPDLILTAGRRPAMAALWVHAQSGKRARTVLLGRPKRYVEAFDLVVATTQYRMPPRPNVLRLGLPLMRGDNRAVAKATAAWGDRLEPLPRPLTAVLVGGPTKPYTMDAQVANDLVERVVAHTAPDNGTLYAVTSRRTPPAVTQTLASRLPSGSRLYRWGSNEDNPFLALLGLADRFVVTGDSISMMMEVARQGKPLAIFPLPARLRLGKRLKHRIAAALHRSAVPWRGQVADTLNELGLIRYVRDLAEVHNVLVERGLAVYLGEPFRVPRTPVPDELPLVLERIRSLFRAPSGA